MLISVKGAQALGEAGAHRAADLVRRAEACSGRAAEMQLQDVVRTALTELSSIDFLIMLGKVDDPYAAFQVFVILEETRRPVPRFLPIARALVKDVAYSIRHRVWSESIFCGFAGIFLVPFWKVQHLRSVRPLKRHEKEWFRARILDFILKYADIVFLRRACNAEVYTKKEHSRFLNDDRIVYVA